MGGAAGVWGVWGTAVGRVAAGVLDIELAVGEGAAMGDAVTDGAAEDVCDGV